KQRQEQDAGLETADLQSRVTDEPPQKVSDEAEKRPPPKNSQWIALFQQDGNFVVYRTEPVWASNTHGMDQTRLCMQGDCNLVMYNDEHHPRWQTNTAKGGCNTCVLSLTDEGNLVLEKDGHEIWDSDYDHGMK
ncbi:transposase protein, partial [Pyrenophora tritici-repentis]